MNIYFDSTEDLGLLTAPRTGKTSIGFFDAPTTINAIPAGLWNVALHGGFTLTIKEQR